MKKILCLKELGVAIIELMPVFQRDPLEESVRMVLILVCSIDCSAGDCATGAVRSPLPVLIQFVSFHSQAAHVLRGRHWGGRLVLEPATSCK